MHGHGAHVRLRSVFGHAVNAPSRSVHGALSFRARYRRAPPPSFHASSSREHVHLVGAQRDRSHPGRFPTWTRRALVPPFCVRPSRALPRSFNARPRRDHAAPFGARPRVATAIPFRLRSGHAAPPLFLASSSREHVHLVGAKPDRSCPGLFRTITRSALAPPFCVCLLYTSPSPRDQRGARMPSSA